MSSGNYHPILSWFTRPPHQDPADWLNLTLFSVPTIVQPL